MRSRSADHSLLGPYALDAVGQIERKQFERHLGDCRDCSQQLRGFRETAVRLVLPAGELPAAQVRERTVAAAARTGQLPGGREAAVPSPLRRIRPTRRLGVQLLAVAAVIAVAATLSVTLRSAPARPAATQARLIAAVLAAPDAQMLTAPVRPDGMAVVVMSPGQRRLVFTGTRLPALPKARGYELWLIRGHRMVPEGMLPPPRHGMTGPVLASGLASGDRLGLTVEPAAGSTQPSSPMLLELAL